MLIGLQVPDLDPNSGETPAEDVFLWKDYSGDWSRRRPWVRSRNGCVLKCDIPPNIAMGKMVTNQYRFLGVPIFRPKWTVVAEVWWFTRTRGKWLLMPKARPVMWKEVSSSHKCGRCAAQKVWTILNEVGGFLKWGYPKTGGTPISGNIQLLVGFKVSNIFYFPSMEWLSSWTTLRKGTGMPYAVARLGKLTKCKVDKLISVLHLEA